MNWTGPRRPIGFAALIAAVGLSGCGDGLLQPDRVPTGVAFEEQVITVTEGDPITLRPFVVDQDGNRFDRLPLWAEFGWSSSNVASFDPARPELRAGAPGLARTTVTFAGLSGDATVRVNPAALNVAVPHAYLVQAVQRRNGTVPLVAGRAATLRVFARGDAVNFFQPDVRVTLYMGDTPVGTERFGLTAGGAIPERVDEGVFQNSWAVDVPAAMVQPGLGFVVEIDPDGTLPLVDRAAARFPATGIQPADVREVPDLEIRFVPITQNQFGTTGQISEGTAPFWTEYLEDVFPISGIDRGVRAAFSTDAAQSGGQTDWYRIIQEIWALRVMDGDDRYYYGVLRGHGGNIAGLGYVGWPVAIGWDDLRTVQNDPVPLAYTTFAHEMGHNFGRWHSPACGPSQVDPNYPYGGGTAGVYGLNRSTGTITTPADHDLMGYCRPHWVSDYTYEGVLDFRLEEEDWRRRYHLEGDTGPGILVWGSVVDGQVRLEPTIALDRTRPMTDSDEGPVVEGLDANGQVIFRQIAATLQFSHAPAGSAAFSATVPLTPAQAERLASIRVAGAGVPEVTRRSHLASSPGDVRALAGGRTPAFSAAAAARGRTEVTWDADRYPLVVVREADTGTVVAFARNGRFTLPRAADQLRFDMSDGVRTVRARPETR